VIISRIISFYLDETYLYNATETNFRGLFAKRRTTRPQKEIQKMKKATQETALKPVLHGFLLSNGTFITPAEMELMESLGVVRATKS